MIINSGGQVLLEPLKNNQKDDLSIKDQNHIIQMREGYLYKRSDYIKAWRKRYIVVNENQLQIFGNSKKNKQSKKEIDLGDYDIKWNDKKKGFINFILHSLKKNATYKLFLLGEKDEEIAQQWYELLKSIIVQYHF